jgi:hypothetical protein
VHPSVFRPSLAEIGWRLSPVPDPDVDERAVLTDVKDVTGHVVLEGIPDGKTELSEVRSHSAAHTLSAAYWHLVANLAFRVHFLHPNVLRVLGCDNVRTCFSGRDAFRGTAAPTLSLMSARYHKLPSPRLSFRNEYSAPFSNNNLFSTSLPWYLALYLGENLTKKNGVNFRVTTAEKSEFSRGRAFVDLMKVRPYEQEAARAKRHFNDVVFTRASTRV